MPTKGTPKNLAGPAIVLVIIVLAALGAGLTWRNYAIQAPSTRDAHTIDANTVEATFAPADAPHLKPGMKAIVTIASLPGRRLLGLVDGVNGTTVRVHLKNPPPGLTASLPAQVTIDTSVPPQMAAEEK